jgi:NADH-quinone oxidoreductase subunit J
MTEVSLPVFYGFTIVALFSAFMVVTRRNPVHSALYLVVTLFSVAAIYVVLHAEFLAMVQILVYVGGIMVLFLFVIFLVRPTKEDETTWRTGPHVVTAMVLTLVIVAALAMQLLQQSPGTVNEAAVAREAAFEGGNIGMVSLTLFRYYLLPFETVSILLLVAMVGAIVLARPERKEA